MGRYTSSSAYHFRIKQEGVDDYRMSWVVDFYYADSRLRYPRLFSRYTNQKGAERFCKKHNLPSVKEEMK